MDKYPPAVQRAPATPNKFYPEKNAVSGVVLHSAEGSRAGLAYAMDGPDVSWHFSVLKDGTVWQHYTLGASCWHAGSKSANTRFIGVEHEGRAGEPLTEAQVVASVALVRWIAEQAGWTVLKRGVTLFEHNELTQTACPSGRIPWDRYVMEPQPTPNGEFLPEVDVSSNSAMIGAAAAMYRFAVAGPDSRTVVTEVPASRSGWRAWKVEVLQ